MTNYPKISVILTAIFILLAIIVLSWLKFLFVPVITDKQGYHYLVKPGTSIRFVRDDLYQKKIIPSWYYFGVLIHFSDKSEALKAGEYLFRNGSTPLSILHQMISGSGMIYYEFTIVPGWTFKELRQALLLDDHFHHQLVSLSDTQVMAALHHTQFNPEGEFFPDTYYFTQGSSDIALLKRAFNAMQTKLKTAWDSKMAHLPYHSPYEVLIAASLIEKEAFLANERAMIAGVLMNRMNKNMLLQFDPTVIYGLGSAFDGKIHREDLIKDTPYNTYLHKGLPPSPIAMPSLDSIMAVVHPCMHDYLFFVAKGDGSHQFSKTLAEHNAYIATMKNTN